MQSILAKTRNWHYIYNNLYSFVQGAKRENMEVLEAIKEVNTAIDKNVASICYRGMDRPVCRDFTIENRS
jgi:hypothetical protein